MTSRFREVLVILGIVLVVVFLFSFGKCPCKRSPEVKHPGQSSIRTTVEENEQETDDWARLPLKIISTIKGVLSDMDSYSFLGKKRIFKNGKYLPEERMKVEIARKSKKVHIKWVGRVKRGQEVWWPAEEGDDRILARGPGWKRIFKVKLDPLSPRAMKDSLHPIYEIGFDYMVKMFEEQIALCKKYHIQPKVVDCSTEDRLCLEIYFPKDEYPEFYCYKAKIEVYRDVGLPARVQVWDKVGERLMLVEDYSYDSISLN